MHEITLEFVRTRAAEKPHAFAFGRQGYLVRSGTGDYRSIEIDWDRGLLNDLHALQQPGVADEKILAMGARLRALLDVADWRVHEQNIERTVNDGRRVVLAIRSSAAELYAIPWELLTIRSTGQTLGELPEIVVRYEWPSTETRRRDHPAGEGIVFAWSDAGGSVPHEAHLAAIRSAALRSGTRFDSDVDVVPQATMDTLARALDERRPAALHVLCHGAEHDGQIGLALHGTSGGRDIVLATRLRRVLGDHASRVRTVVLCACRSGDTGRQGNRVGSLAQAIHRAGVESVVASRFPLTKSGSTELTDAFYTALLADDASIEEAFVSARRRLLPRAGLDWASLQLHRRSEGDGEERGGEEAEPSPWFHRLWQFMKGHRVAVAVAAGFFLTVCLAFLGTDLAALFTSEQATPIHEEPAVPAGPLLGIDISNWNGEIDWEAVKNAGVGFAFVKGSESGFAWDRKYAENWREMKRAGIVRGVYHVYKIGRDPEQQANNLIKWLVLEPGDLPPAVDFEKRGEDLPPDEKIIADLHVYLDTLEQHYGVKPIIYAIPKFWHAHMDASFQDHPLWMAHWSDEEPEELWGFARWTFWQYTPDGVVDGVEGRVDMNRFAGTRDELQALTLGSD